MMDQFSISIIALNSKGSTNLPPWVEPLHRYLRDEESLIEAQWIMVSPDIKPFLPCDFDLVIQTPINRMLPFIYNLMLSSVRADFVLWADSSWCFKLTKGSKLFSSSMHALQRNQSFSQVKLHTEDVSDFSDKSVYSGPIFEIDGIPFYIQSPRKILGGITLGPSICKMDSLRDLGPMSENAFSFMAMEAEYCARSTLNESHLALRSPNLTPFHPFGKSPFKLPELIVEKP